MSVIIIIPHACCAAAAGLRMLLHLKRSLRNTPLLVQELLAGPSWPAWALAIAACMQPERGERTSLLFISTNSKPEFGIPYLI
eukprot:3414030-Rhodomonas_salina.2